MPLPSKEELFERIRELEQENQHLRQAQAGSREQAAYFAAILDNTPAPIYLKDADFRYLLVNKQYELLSQSTLQEIKGKSDFDIFPTAVAELFRTQDEAVLEQNRPLEFEETIPCWAVCTVSSHPSSLSMTLMETYMPWLDSVPTSQNARRWKERERT
jgi:PAS domain-containing protein